MIILLIYFTFVRKYESKIMICLYIYFSTRFNWVIRQFFKSIFVHGYHFSKRFITWNWWNLFWVHISHSNIFLVHAYHFSIWNLFWVHILGKMIWLYIVFVKDWLKMIWLSKMSYIWSLTYIQIWWQLIKDKIHNYF